jgi:hypothetical protein
LIDECDEAARYQRRRWVDFPFEKRNTGFEGLSAVRWHGQDYLLALCEGNRCRAGRKGRKAGGGRIQVLVRRGTAWSPIARIKLPARVAFEDFSAVALRGNRIAVLSQLTSRLWIGTLRLRDWTIAGRGRILDFPQTRKGKPKYCTLESLSWVSPTTFVVVSDLSKRSYGRRCRKTDQSTTYSGCPGAEHGEPWSAASLNTLSNHGARADGSGTMNTKRASCSCRGLVAAKSGGFPIYHLPSSICHFSGRLVLPECQIETSFKWQT